MTTDELISGLKSIGYELVPRKIPATENGESCLICTLRPNGQIYFNKWASAFLEAVGALRVFILWDKETSKVAFFPAMTGEPRSYEVTYRHKDNGAVMGASVRARTLSRFAGLKIDKPVKVMLTVDGSRLEGVVKI